MRIALAQINPTVGDIQGNTNLILQSLRTAEQKNCRLTVFPELALTGYPPEDLLLKPAFIKDNLRALKHIASHVKGQSAAVLGFVDEEKGLRYNAAAWLEKGKVAGIYHKMCLPNYGVFDEERYFSAGQTAFVRTWEGARIGITICEDIWLGPPPLKSLKNRKPHLVINLSASPFHAGKLVQRQDIVREAARYLNSPLLYCNTVGGQDELVFDGGSFIVSANGKTAAQLPQFQSGVFVVEMNLNGKKTGFSAEGIGSTKLSRTEEIFHALALGTRDYVTKNGFQKVALGLSGGIDSALVACLAVEALGPDRLITVTMPSQYNRAETREDAAKLAKNLGIQFIEIPIQSVFAEFLKALNPTFTGLPTNIAEENLQARVRGTLLMALSNKFNWLVLTTANKSETSVGYSTLYGDTAGGFAVLKDVLKTTVYDLARLVNSKAGREVIPQSTIDRPPTAELRENQKDEDSLGPYAELDPVIVGYVENNLSPQEIVKEYGLNEAYVRRIIALIDRNEYKRRQSPPGIKITPRSFGRDHRMPITNRYGS